MLVLHGSKHPVEQPGCCFQLNFTIPDFRYSLQLNMQMSLFHSTDMQVYHWAHMRLFSGTEFDKFNVFLLTIMLIFIKTQVHMHL